jgi:hypothetical protein
MIVNLQTQAIQTLEQVRPFVADTNHEQTRATGLSGSDPGALPQGEPGWQDGVLDEFCAVCSYHRKYAIRLLGRKKPVSTSRRVGRKLRYDRR